MDYWNFDISAAPRGKTEKRERKVGKNTIMQDVFIPDKIIACSQDGKTVTTSHWIDAESRWNMFATTETPLAWMPWPGHPQPA